MTPAHQDQVRSELRDERERIVRTLLVALAVLGIFAYVPSVWLGLRVGAYGIVAIDTLAYVAVLLTLIFARGHTTFQSVLLVGLTYLLGLMLSLTLGPIGAGPMWLTMVPVVAAVLLGRLATYTSLAGVLLTGVAIGVAHAGGWLSWDPPPIGTSLWAVLYGNGVLLGGGVAIAVATLVRSLRASAERAARITEELDEKHERLLSAHRRAEEEAAERRQVEAQLRQSEKLTAIGTLATGIAHDFNNLMTPILAAPELLAEDGLPEADRTRILDQVERAALAGRELVRRLLSFSRPANTEREPVDAASVLHDAIRLLRASLPPSVTFDVQVDEDAGHVLLTPAEIHQLILNLGSNAHKAMDEGGTLTVRLAQVSGADARQWSVLEAPRRAVRLTVSDDGQGMDPETAAQIFDPFFTTDSDRGTGLGMATVHGIVTSVDGVIRCESEQGRGTTFVIHLPVAEARSSEAMAPSVTAVAPGRDLHVLLVDDDEPVRDVSSRALRKQGFTVSPAADAPSALEILEEDPGIDLVVTDLNMPGFKGTRLARDVRSRRPGMPIILMTGLMDSEVEREAEEIGIDGLLAKPFRVDELLSAIEAAVVERV